MKQTRNGLTTAPFLMLKGFGDAFIQAQTILSWMQKRTDGGHPQGHFRGIY
jgi:hypothetical protein